MARLVDMPHTAKSFYQPAETSTPIDQRQMFDKIMCTMIQNIEHMDTGESQDEATNNFDLKKSLISLPFKIDDIKQRSSQIQ